jgi:peptide/nickel transport system substrate-binding protein
MPKLKRFNLALALTLVLALLLSACGATNTPVPATTAPAVATTAPVAATTAPVANTTAPAQATTASTVATTAPAASPTAATSGAYDLKPAATLADLPANAKKGGKFTKVIGAKLAPALHRYPSATNNTSTRTDVATLIFGAGLVEYNYTDLRFTFDAAKSLKVSADNKTFTFTMRDDLKWSDGSAITMDDYQFAYEQYSKDNKETPTDNYVGLADVKRFKSHKADAATNTITIELDAAYPSDLALSYIASNVGPLPKKLWEGKAFQDGGKNPEILKPTLVNGPYMIKSYDPNGEGSFVPNPYYYRGKPNFDEIVYKSSDAAVMVESVRTGQADWANNFPPAQVAQVKEDSKFKYLEWAGVNSGYRFVEYNTTKTPLNDKAFRQALNYATDRNSLIKLAENGLGQAQFSFLSPLSNWYNKETPEYKYNVATAKKMLADAGYKLDGTKLMSKDGKPIELTVLYPTSSPPRKLVATYMEQQFKDLGVTIKVEGLEFQAYVDRVDAKNFDIALGNRGGGFPDPDSFKSLFTSDGTQNKTGYKNPRVDELFKQGAVEVDPTKRKVIYDEIQKIIGEDSPIYFLWALTDYAMFNKSVEGVKPNKGQRLEYNDTWLRWFYAAS